MARRKSKSLRKRIKQSGVVPISIVVLLICGIVSYKKVGLEEKRNAYKEEEVQKQEELKKEEERTEELEEKKAYVNTKKYIEEVAREKLGLVYEDEIIFKAE